MEVCNTRRLISESVVDRRDRYLKFAIAVSEWETRKYLPFFLTSTRANPKSTERYHLEKEGIAGDFWCRRARYDT